MDSGHGNMPLARLCKLIKRLEILHIYSLRLNHEPLRIELRAAGFSGWSVNTSVHH